MTRAAEDAMLDDSRREARRYDSAEFRTYFRNDMEKWRKAVNAAGLSASQ